MRPPLLVRAAQVAPASIPSIAARETIGPTEREAGAGPASGNTPGPSGAVIASCVGGRHHRPTTVPGTGEIQAGDQRAPGWQAERRGGGAHLGQPLLDEAVEVGGGVAGEGRRLRVSPRRRGRFPPPLRRRHRRDARLQLAAAGHAVWVQAFSAGL